MTPDALRAEAEKLADALISPDLPITIRAVTDALVAFAHRLEVVARSDTWRQAAEMVNEPTHSDFLARSEGILRTEFAILPKRERHG